MKTKNTLQVQNGLVVPVDTLIVKKIIGILSRKVFKRCDEKFCIDYLQDALQQYAVNADLYQNIRERFSVLYETRKQLAREFNNYQKEKVQFLGNHILIGNPIGVSYKCLELVEERCFDRAGCCLWFTQDNPLKQSFRHPLKIAMYEFQADVVDINFPLKNAELDDYQTFKEVQGMSYEQDSPLTIVPLPIGKELDFLDDTGRALVSSGFSTILFEFSQLFISESKNGIAFQEMLADLKKAGKEILIGSVDFTRDGDYQGFLSELEGVLQ